MRQWVSKKGTLALSQGVWYLTVHVGDTWGSGWKAVLTVSRREGTSFKNLFRVCLDELALEQRIEELSTLLEELRSKLGKQQRIDGQVVV